MRLPAVLGALLLTTAVAVQPVAAASSPTPATVPNPGGLLAHKALYTLTLESAKSTDVVTGAGALAATAGGTVVAVTRSSAPRTAGRRMKVSAEKCAASRRLRIGTPRDITPQVGNRLS